MKMKWKFSALALCTAVSLTAFNAAAGTTADLSVIGTIAPASCTPTLSNGAVVNYGSISPTSLTAVAPALNQLGTKKIALTITCTGQTLVALNAADNRSASEVTLNATTFIANAGASSVSITTNDQAYGLGTATTSSAQIGAYTLAANIMNVTVTDGADDSFEADVLTTRDTTLSSATWTKATGGFLNPTGAAGTHLTFAKAGSLVPTAIKTAEVPLYVTAAVQPMSAFAADFSANEVIELDGNATISLVYL